MVFYNEISCIKNPLYREIFKLEIKPKEIFLSYFVEEKSLKRASLEEQNMKRKSGESFIKINQGLDFLNRDCLLLNKFFFALEIGTISQNSLFHYIMAFFMCFWRMEEEQRQEELRSQVG